MGLPGLTSLLFILVTIGCFVFILQAVTAQKRFSLLLTDFINNMTHEFKTPISTSLLAGEILGREETANQKDKIQNYARIIREEGTRMRFQVEKILEMALLESRDFHLKISSLDVHQLIENAAGHFSLIIEKLGGTVTLDLHAEQRFIEADPEHLLNVLHNLIDNGIKYNREKPHIQIFTGLEGRHFKIAVKDNGIGMAPEEKKHIFDKYYRASTGNRHDVKGFGLGLSYVHRIIKAHQGIIRVSSAKKIGSVFEILLPVSQTKGRTPPSKPGKS
jgi:two-component system phosphate regulon sensor histidine kinase PhoR